MDIYEETDFNKLNIYHNKWDELCNQNITNTVFQTYEWNKVWWNVYGKKNDLFLVLASENSDLLGIAPLMIVKEQKRIGEKRVLKFIGSGASDYSDFIFQSNRPDVLKKTISFILDNKEKWDVIELFNIPEYSSSREIFINICVQKGFHHLERSTSCPTLIIRDNLEYAIKVSNKKSLRRHFNFFKRQGEFDVFHLFEKSQIVNYLQTFFDQHISRWEGTNTPSLFLDKNNRLFYEELTKELTGNNWLIFTVIKSKEVPISFHFGFDYNNKLIWYKPSFEISLSRHSPGEVLLKELLEFAIRSKKDELDFTVGSELYKRRFSNLIRRNDSICVFKNKRDFYMEKLISILRKWRIYIFGICTINY